MKHFVKDIKIIPFQDTFLRIIKVPVTGISMPRTDHRRFVGGLGVAGHEGGAVTGIGRFTVESSDVPK